jgi:hypothetical protein
MIHVHLLLVPIDSDHHKQHCHYLRQQLLLRRDFYQAKLCVVGNKQKFTNFAIASKAFKDSSTMDLGALETHGIY